VLSLTLPAFRGFNDGYDRFVVSLTQALFRGFDDRTCFSWFRWRLNVLLLTLFRVSADATLEIPFLVHNVTALFLPLTLLNSIFNKHHATLIACG